MEILTKVKKWASEITDVGVSLLALGIVLEVLLQDRTFRSGQTLALYLTFKISLQVSQHKV